MACLSAGLQNPPLGQLAGGILIARPPLVAMHPRTRPSLPPPPGQPLPGAAVSSEAILMSAGTAGRQHPVLHYCRPAGPLVCTPSPPITLHYTHTTKVHITKALLAMTKHATPSQRRAGTSQQGHAQRRASFSLQNRLQIP